MGIGLLSASGVKFNGQATGSSVRPTEMYDQLYHDGLLRRNGYSVAELVAMDREDRWFVLGEFAACVAERRAPASSGRDNLGTIASDIRRHGVCKDRTGTNLLEFTLAEVRQPPRPTDGGAQGQPPHRDHSLGS